MKVTSVQPTPNPSAFKFITDRVLARELRNYNTPAEAKNDLLATAIFAIPNLTNLFFMDDFVTVTMERGADWKQVKDQVVRVLESTFVEDTLPKGTSAKPAGATVATGSKDEQELMHKIEACFEDRVRPALAGDGGGLEILGLEGKTLRIRYQGACGTCPSSIAGTLNAIQNMLQSEIDEELTVIAG